MLEWKLPSEGGERLTQVFEGLRLLIPDKQDEERDAVAEAWKDGGGVVTRVGRFWDPPEFERKAVRLYGPDTFCEVLAQKLALELISPVQGMVARVGHEWTHRKVSLSTLSEVRRLTFPIFVKSLAPKVFRARCYSNVRELDDECRELDDGCPVIISEPVEFTCEVRTFIRGCVVRTGSVYRGEGDVQLALKFAQEFSAQFGSDLTYVLDVGLIAGRGWGVVESNAAWGAGLNGCDPRAAARCIAEATRCQT